MMRVVRLCTVYEPPRRVALGGRARRFDPIGGMQNHTGCLTRALDALGVAQDVVTTRPPGAPAYERVGEHAVVHRLGLPLPWMRQAYAPAAALQLHALASGADVVHAHLGEDVAIVPMALSAARRHGARLVLTIHLSVAHTYVANGWRSRVIQALGGRLERVGTRAADAAGARSAPVVERYEVVSQQL